MVMIWITAIVAFNIGLVLGFWFCAAVTISKAQQAHRRAEKTMDEIMTRARAEEETARKIRARALVN